MEQIRSLGPQLSQMKVKEITPGKISSSFEERESEKQGFYLFD